MKMQIIFQVNHFEGIPRFGIGHTGLLLDTFYFRWLISHRLLESTYQASGKLFL